MEALLPFVEPNPIQVSQNSSFLMTYTIINIVIIKHTISDKTDKDYEADLT